MADKRIVEFNYIRRADHYLYSNGKITMLDLGKEGNLITESLPVIVKVDEVDYSVSLNTFFVIDDILYSQWTDSWTETIGEEDDAKTISHSKTYFLTQEKGTKIVESIDEYSFPTKPEVIIGGFKTENYICESVVGYEEVFRIKTKSGKSIMDTSGIDYAVELGDYLIFNMPNDYLSNTTGLYIKYIKTKSGCNRLFGNNFELY